MDMTMEQALRPTLAQAFALKRGRGYVMRSEKRPGYGGNSPNRGGRKPRPPKAGILYILFTVLMCILLWPVGLVMLWSRRVRLQTGTKLLISLLTLCVSVFLIVFALTVHVEDERVTQFQDKANDWLNKAASDIAVAGDAAYKKTSETWAVMTEFAGNAIGPAMNTLADGIDKGVDLAGTVRSKVETLVASRDQGVNPSSSAAPEGAQPGTTGAAPAAIEPWIPEYTPDPASARPLSGGMLVPGGTLIPDETPVPTPTPEATPAPAATETPTPEATDEGGEIEVNAVPTPEMSAEPTEEAPEATPEVEPTEAPELAVKPAGKATVYYNKVGKLYHMRSTCKSMTKSTAYTLSQAIADGKEKCNSCGSPDPSVLKIEHIAWVDANKTIHTTDECPKFKGRWQLISLETAVSRDYATCPDCKADTYAVETLGIATPEPTEAPTPELTEAPTPEPTDTPEPEAEETHEPEIAVNSEIEANETPEPEADDTPEPETGETPEPEAEETPEPEPSDSPEPEATPVAEETVSESVEAEPTLTPLKPAGEAIVYHSSNGKFYHRFRTCKAMSGSDPYPLKEITEKYKYCKTCKPPQTSLVDVPCMWVDENDLCHTSDTCEAFQGHFTLVPIDEAIKQNLTACPDCGAATYLVPSSEPAA